MANPMDSEDGQTIQAVERSFKIVDFLFENESATVSEIAKELDYTMSTSHIHLKTLRNVGYVVKEGDRYELGLRFLRNGISIRRRHQLYHVAKPEIDQISEETGEGLGLAMEENGQRVTLYSARSDSAVHDNAPVGEFTNMHWTALGKALLAQKEEEDIRKIVDRYGLPEATDQTITDIDELYEEMEKTRERGYAIENEERREGLRSLALPISGNEETIGAVSITGPVHRINDERIQSELLELLQDAVTEIEIKYRYN